MSANVHQGDDTSSGQSHVNFKIKTKVRSFQSHISCSRVGAAFKHEAYMCCEREFKVVAETIECTSLTRLPVQTKHEAGLTNYYLQPNGHGLHPRSD